MISHTIYSLVAGAGYNFSISFAVHCGGYSKAMLCTVVVNGFLVYVYLLC